MYNKVERLADFEYAYKKLEAYKSIKELEDDPGALKYFATQLLGPKGNTLTKYIESDLNFEIKVKEQTPTRKRLPAATRGLPATTQQTKLPFKPDFEPLRQWLQEIINGKNLLAVPFNQLEAIIGISLSEHAKQTLEGWQDPDSDKSLVPGFKVIDVNPVTQTIIFEKE